MPWNVWDVNGGQWMMLQSVASKAKAEAAIKDFAKEYPSAHLEARQVRSHLEQHGTTLMQFKPEAIWRMAMADFDRRAGNANADVTEMKHYNFHRDHVRKATTANDILRAAIADLERGRGSGKKITRLLYGDAEQLRKALQ